MTDFTNGFNPHNKQFNGAQFNTNKQGSGATPEGQNAPAEQSMTDPYTGQRLSPDEIFKLMNAQAQFNKTTGVDSSSISQSIAAFENAISPESHAQMMKDTEHVFQNEFGFKPSSNLTESIVANHLMGQPSIQKA